jgi:hypothetical protein
MNAEKPKASATEAVVTSTGHPANFDTARETPTPRITPIAPPITESVTASSRNCIST